MSAIPTTEARAGGGPGRELEVPAGGRSPAGAGLPAGLGAAAARFAELSLRKSDQTKATYLSSYRRFAIWLADHTGLADPPPAALTADVVAAYVGELEAVKAPATVKKERAAINRLAKHLHALGAIDATEILMIEGSRSNAKPRRRKALHPESWQQVKQHARARTTPDPARRNSQTAGARDLALILVLGEMGLRSEEARTVRLDGIAPRRPGASRPWLHVLGKGDKQRNLPIPAEVATPLEQWLQCRDQVPELAADPLLFPRLGRPRRDGSWPDAGARLSGHALREIVAPVMAAAGVPALWCHPHVLRHTYGTLFMADPDAKIERLQALMGHASISTTARYLHQTDDDLEAAVDRPPAPRSLLAADARRRRERNTRRAA